MYSQVAIQQAGKKAHSFLVPGQRGRVLAAFSKAVYLLTVESDLLWLAGEGTPMHERCTVVSPFVSPLPAGAPFFVEGSRLIVGQAITYTIGNVTTWSPPPPSCIVRLAELAARLEAIIPKLDCSQARGFGSFIPLIQQLWQDRPIHDLQYTDPVLQCAQPKVLNIARACLEGNTSLISENAERLVGLGTGLTPSGDDFLGGLLFAIKALQTYYPSEINIALHIPIENYVSRTHPISFTLLKDLADGSAVEPLHHVLNNLLAGNSINSIHCYVSQLTDIGHSTGWDLLTGLLTGLLAARGNHCFNSSLQITQSMYA
jgi:hypothetical protein